jgi:NAD(P)-dependent dehydrogenase (short-subunit alcohol dehydrogenase family)
VNHFNGRVAAVTGAASGIGRALALRLAREGAAVALADVDEQGLTDTASLLQGSDHSQHVLDVADRQAVEGFAESVVRSHGRVHFVFNNAGVDVSARVDAMTHDDFQWLMNINFWGVVHGCRAFLPHLKENGFGHLVNTSSIFGLVTVPTQAAYHASKFAVRGYSECLRQELAEYGVRVSYVMPGGVKTNVVRNSRYRVSDNQSLTKEEAITRFEAMAGLTPDAAAERILAGVARNRARILVGRDARLLALLAWLAPVNYPRLVRLLRIMQRDDLPV